MRSPRRKPSASYRVTLSVGDYVFDNEADTVVGAMETLFTKDKMLKNRAKLSVHSGGLSSEINLYPVQLRRLMVNKTTREVLAKRLITLLH